SEPPTLLAPITQAGRKGPACKPEQAAASADRREAMLPTGEQLYGAPQPVPRTTAEPVTRAQALQREVTTRFSIGLEAENRGKWDRAIPEFERIASLASAEPQGSTAHYDLALAYAHLGRDDDASTQLHDAIELDPGFLAAMANLISIDLRRGDLAGARSIADRLLSIEPDSARGLYSRGIIALATGDAKTAQTDFGRLIAADPSYAVAHYDLGLVEQQLGHTTDALREVTTSLDLAPGNARARFALATVLLKAGKYAAARAAFDRAARDAHGDASLATLALSMRDAIEQQ
ncbi:MAG: tetratricopeptide repeat protein, partial [Candidatus Eremiobacteraeota bacterium]|nr:tetratricopeptide repeat protein [Candidatus Eremiobacteraeota bacterium]